MFIPLNCFLPDSDAHTQIAQLNREQSRQRGLELADSSIKGSRLLGPRVGDTEALPVGGGGGENFSRAATAGAGAGAGAGAVAGA